MELYTCYSKKLWYDTYTEQLLIAKLVVCRPSIQDHDRVYCESSVHNEFPTVFSMFLQVCFHAFTLAFTRFQCMLNHQLWGWQGIGPSIHEVTGLLCCLQHL